MKQSKLFAPVLIATVIIASLAIAEEPKDSKPAAGGQPEMKLPPGWTAEDMAACMAASTPGKNHEMLARSGRWVCQ